MTDYPAHDAMLNDERQQEGELPSIEDVLSPLDEDLFIIRQHAFLTTPRVCTEIHTGVWYPDCEIHVVLRDNLLEVYLGGTRILTLYISDWQRAVLAKNGLRIPKPGERRLPALTKPEKVSASPIPQTPKPIDDDCPF